MRGLVPASLSKYAIAATLVAACGAPGPRLVASPGQKDQTPAVDQRPTGSDAGAPPTSSPGDGSGERRRAGTDMAEGSAGSGPPAPGSGAGTGGAGGTIGAGGVGGAVVVPPSAAGGRGGGQPGAGGSAAGGAGGTATGGAGGTATGGAGGTAAGGAGGTGGRTGTGGAAGTGPSTGTGGAAPGSPSQGSTTIEVGASDDGYVQGSGDEVGGGFVDNSSKVFAHEPLLLAKFRPGEPHESFYWRESFIAFEVRGAGPIGRASLVLHVGISDASASTTLHVREAQGVGWSEEDLCWANRPTVGPVLASAAVATVERARVELDVTAYVRAQLDAGSGRVGFGLMQDPAVAYLTAARIEVDAREAGATGPRLVIVGAE